MFGPTFSSSVATSLPVRLSSAIIVGTCGDGMCLCDLSTPFDGFTYTRSPWTSTEHDEASWGQASSSAIMS